VLGIAGEVGRLPERLEGGVVKDRLDVMAEILPQIRLSASSQKFFELLLEELRMQRDRTDQWERFIGSLRKEFQ
jgi:hypothetical protein